ncbi:hypothetical protein FHQ26_02780 [Testudinibacter sp. TR-2022]|uniref:hypothetical protein n=1 Tax=Testudinibacter sp. TR-2022 TaxID=2585029 RepID=UPI00111A6AA4|nr:hypothetical protein [Testudinibacter sp. TR-2022]TNH04159.1 hypothetical protein FHQ22_05565 [Pasteurellaceae bacterium Phil31]TNH11889.1 hypothetical protein FHQ26_02780 [Testudinibacter sp. TR-2022]TNH12586.1 hypothetical protein FHQ25_00050 [Testudinibacter sp. TR-2022]TNH16144.1 hypothetical protein FIA56_02195 [Testudinibacter sp. TR-2022]TNH18231.1 hypothetical protein FHQ23_05260 [Testudinibacter sp. TR-2022]
MKKMKDWLQGTKQKLAEIWQQQRKKLQQSGLSQKYSGVAALILLSLFLLMFGLLSLLLLAAFSLIAALQLLFAKKPVLAAEQVIIETTAVRHNAKL